MHIPFQIKTFNRFHFLGYKSFTQTKPHPILREGKTEVTQVAAVPVVPCYWAADCIRSYSFDASAQNEMHLHFLSQKKNWTKWEKNFDRFSKCLKSDVWNWQNTKSLSIFFSLAITLSVHCMWIIFFDFLAVCSCFRNDFSSLCVEHFWDQNILHRHYFCTHIELKPNNGAWEHTSLHWINRKWCYSYKSYVNISADLKATHCRSKHIFLHLCVCKWFIAFERYFAPSG